MYERHYSAHRYRDGRRRALFAGPGEKIVLRTGAGDAFFVWRKFVDDCIDHRTGKPQQGVNCAAFRREDIRSEDSESGSKFVRQADAIADFVWSDRRHYTYVDEEEVGGELPGACFLFAGWRYVRKGKHRARTNSGKLILEKWRRP